VGSLIIGLHRAPGGTVNYYVYSNVCVRHEEQTVSEGNGSDLQSEGVIAQGTERPSSIAFLQRRGECEDIFWI